MAGDINFENDERRSTGTSTASLTIKRLLLLKARLFVLAGAKRDIGQVVVVGTEVDTADGMLVQ